MNGKISNIEQLCSARKLKFYDGREKGENVIIVENGCLSFTVLQDRGFDIYDLKHKGVNIAFLNKGGICGFNSDFNTMFNGGMLYTCGLDSLGRRKEPIHGKYHNIPATLSSIKSDNNGIELTATIRDAGLFANNLQLERTISCAYNSGKILVKNRLTNLGYKDAEYCLLFHINIGYPMLDEGVKIEAPIINTIFNKDNAQESIAKCLKIEEPTANAKEECFYHDVAEGCVKVINEKIKKSVNINYDKEKLPCLVEWKSMVSGDYALGIEPSTTSLVDEFSYNILKASKYIDFDLTIEVNDI